MTIDLLIKIAGIGLLTAVISQVLNQAGKNEIATLSSLAGVVIVLIMVVEMVAKLFDSVKTLFGLY